MPIAGYLKIPDVPGESLRADHEDEIDIHGLQWAIHSDTSSATGRGRRRARAEVDQLVLTKFTDASSVYLALANMQGKSFDEVVVSVRKDSGDAHLDYLIITMTNCLISRFEMEAGPPNSTDDLITERVAIIFEKVHMKYTVQADDHSAGNEHEISFDIVAGA